MVKNNFIVRQVFWIAVDFFDGHEGSVEAACSIARIVIEQTSDVQLMLHSRNSRRFNDSLSIVECHHSLDWVSIVKTAHEMAV